MQKTLFSRSWRIFSADTNNMQTFVLLSSTTISFAISVFVFFIVAQRDGIVSAQLPGNQETCDVEDEAITVSDIPNMKCFDCTCKNGFVQCIKPNCPNTDGCYMLQESSNNECCKKCKGCTKNGVYHESGDEWTEPNDPCRLLRCIAGVITDSLIQCYTPCKNRIPPALGQCCPTCPDCRLNAKTITEGTDIVSKNDPCLSCKCTYGKLMCTKKTCPVLNCPESKIVHGYQECCPQCLGTGKYMDPPKGACLLGMKLHHSGTQFNLDDCTSCTCNNSTVYCNRISCPVLSCKPEHQKTLPHQCCAQCLTVNTETSSEERQTGYVNVNEDTDSELEDDDQNDKENYQKHKKLNLKSCTYDDKIYKDGETWNTDSCKTCTCKHGKINCTNLTCPAIRCPPNSSLIIPEGECCPICEERHGVCTVFGGSHVRTFDGKLYAFIGSCKYQLVNDCDGGTFNIRLKNTVLGNDVTIKRISFKLGKLKVDLQQNKNTKVNDQIIDLPYQVKDKLEIKEINSNVVIISKNGIKILWNYLGFLEVTLPKKYRKKVCGLCGDFNSIADNDMTTREGILVDDPAIFAQSWTSGDEICLDTRQYGIKGCNPRKDQRLCSYIKGSIFGKCLKKINVTSYYETCLKDMCDCAPDDLQCHCESFASYVRDCQRLGILLPRWRKSVGC